jgi:hypothetical protein
MVREVDPQATAGLGKAVASDTYASARDGAISLVCFDR